MNEQMIQELAMQIDGQVAQSCGSHDPNVKGTYLYQKYPQVRTCANYTEAIYLLAKEQAALQVPAQQFGHPQGGFGQAQPQGGFGQAQPQGGFGQAQQVTGQPQGGFGQPQGGFGQPNGFGQPQGGFGANQGGFGQPPMPGVFGAPAVPQTGQQGASQFTAFQPQQKAHRDSGKVFGFIPVKAVALIGIVLVVCIVIGGIGVSIKNALNPKAPVDNNAPETQTEQSVDDLFD